MKTIQTRSHVGPDGLLNLQLPVGLANADVDVTVYVQPTASQISPADHEAWRRRIEETAGSIQDPTFMRHEQGEFEERDDWE